MHHSLLTKSILTLPVTMIDWQADGKSLTEASNIELRISTHWS